MFITDSFNTNTPKSPRPKRKRTFRSRMPPDREPAVVFSLLDGAPVATVEAFGRHAKAAFILDAEQWPEVATRWGTRWIIALGRGRPYVASGRFAAAKDATTGPQSTPLAYLARLMTGASRQQVAWFVNGNSLDLRLSNLEVLSRADAAKRRISLRGCVVRH